MQELLAALDVGAGETRYVGGCVRDTLLGLPVSDVDLATRLLPEAVVGRLKSAHIKCVPTGLTHGTITAVISGRPVEITTLRRDVSTDGRRATVAFTDDWEEDAARRDFTINALSADPVNGSIFDYFGGLADLDIGCVRFIGEPLQRIAEDHLRILRFFRFQARFGQGDPDAAAIAACAARANDLMALSRERIADELLKLLAVAQPLPAMRLMVALDILRPVLPEIDEAGVARLGALIERQAAFGVSPDPVRHLAALLPANPEVATAIAGRLRLSKKVSKRLALAADDNAPGPGDTLMSAYRIGSEATIDRLLLAGDESRLAEQLSDLAGWTKPRLPIGGADLIAMGITAGPDVSKLLQAIETDWARSGFDQDRGATEALARHHVDRWLRSSQ